MQMPAGQDADRLREAQLSTEDYEAYKKRTLDSLPCLGWMQPFSDDKFRLQVVKIFLEGCLRALSDEPTGGEAEAPPAQVSERFSAMESLLSIMARISMRFRIPLEKLEFVLVQTVPCGAMHIEEASPGLLPGCSYWWREGTGALYLALRHPAELEAFRSKMDQMGMAAKAADPELRRIADLLKDFSEKNNPEGPEKRPWEEMSRRAFGMLAPTQPIAAAEGQDAQELSKWMQYYYLRIVSLRNIRNTKAYQSIEELGGDLSYPEQFLSNVKHVLSKAPSLTDTQREMLLSNVVHLKAEVDLSGGLDEVPRVESAARVYSPVSRNCVDVFYHHIHRTGWDTINFASNVTLRLASTDVKLATEPPPKASPEFGNGGFRRVFKAHIENCQVHQRGSEPYMDQREHFKLILTRDDIRAARNHLFAGGGEECSEALSDLYMLMYLLAAAGVQLDHMDGWPCKYSVVINNDGRHIKAIEQLTGEAIPRKESIEDGSGDDA